MPQRPLDDFVEGLRNAIRQGVAEIVAARHGEHLSGFALCTDDDLSTLYHVACTREFSSRRRDIDDIDLIPTEWEYNEGDDAFAPSGRILALRLEAARTQNAFGHHVDRAFGDLTVALMVAREESLVPADALLVVTSTDPGEHLVRLAVEAGRRLN